MNNYSSSVMAVHKKILALRGKNSVSSVPFPELFPNDTSIIPDEAKPCLFAQDRMSLTAHFRRIHGKCVPFTLHRRKFTHTSWIILLFYLNTVLINLSDERSGQFSGESQKF